MHRAMMPATLIADLAAERAGLREPEMMGIRGLAAADEARLLGDIAHALGIGGLGDRTDRPIRSNPLAGRVGQHGGQIDHAGGLVDGGGL